jgi:hypothetical protein
VSNLGAISYAPVKPAATGLAVELTGDGGVRVSLVTWPRLWTRIWMTLLPWAVVAAFAGLLKLLIWIPHHLPPGPIPFSEILYWVLLMTMSATMIVYGLAQATICGVVVEIVVRDKWVECTFARLFWQRRKRWPVATIKGVAPARGLSSKQWTLWDWSLKIRRRASFAVHAFKGVPKEELEWAASGLQDALSAAESTQRR